MAWFLLGTLALLYLRLFLFPLIPIWLGSGQAIYLLNATRLLEGEMIYRDFFQFTTPGTELVFLAFFKLLGVKAWIPNLLLMLQGMGLAWLTVRIAKDVVPGAARYLAGVLFVTCAYVIRFALNANHHWFSVLGVMAALAVLIRKRTPRRLAAAGALSGLAYSFTQLRGVAALAGIAVFLLWESRTRRQGWRESVKGQLELFGSFLATVILSNVYFVWRAGLRRYWYCTVVFGAKYYPTESSSNSLRSYMNSWPEVVSRHGWPELGPWALLHALLPLVYGIFLIRYRREANGRLTEPWDRLVLVTLLGLFLFVGIAPAPNWPRLCSISAPAFIVLVWLLNSAGKSGVALTRLVWAVAVVSAAAGTWVSQAQWRAYLDGPVGRMAVQNRVAFERYKWLQDRTRPSEYFFQGSWPDLYFPLGLRNPTEVPFVTAADYTRAEQVESVIGALEKHRVRFVLWWTGLDVPDELHPQADHLAPLRSYLGTHYHPVSDFPGSHELWERSVP